MNAREEKKAADIRIVLDAVTESFIEKPKDLTIKEIAEIVPFSEAKVRKIFNDAQGCIPGLNVSKGERYSGGNYSGAYRSVWVYGPGRTHLVSLIKEISK